MKKTRLILATTIVLAAGMLGISCAPSVQSQPDTTTLNSAPSSLVLTKTDSAQHSLINLSCGCAFPPSSNQPFTVIGYGDTSIITFRFAEPLTRDTNIHTIIASFHPSQQAGSGSSSSWIAFSYPENDYGTFNTLYDTVRVTANY